MAIACPPDEGGIRQPARAITGISSCNLSPVFPKLIAVICICAIPIGLSGQAPKSQTIEYRNAQYGFCFSLPQSWRGYSIVRRKWQGPENPSGNGPITQGPVISIRHPRWKAANPRQDIPIMVLTQAQWRLLQEDKISVSAAPIPPDKLGSNRKYVFLLPPRYNYAFPTGFEEVEKIIQAHPLHAPCG